MRRRIRRIRQLIPTKFATSYGSVQDQVTVPMFATWWMWLGRCYRVRRHVVPYGS